MEDEEYEKVLNEIKIAPSQWSVDEMVENLSKFHLNYYRKQFKQNQIDGKKFLKMKNFEEILDKDDSDTEELLKCIIKKIIEIKYKGQRYLNKLEKNILLTKESKSMENPINDPDLSSKYSSSKKQLRGMKEVESVFVNEENPKKYKESNKEFKVVKRFDSSPIEEEEFEKEKNINKNNKINPIKKIKLNESESEDEEEIPRETNNNKNNKSNQIKKINQIKSGSKKEEIPIPKANNETGDEHTIKMKKPKIENPAEDQTIKIKKKKRPNSNDDDEENKEGLTKKIKKVIPLVLIKKDEEKKEYKIEKTCKIGRSENSTIIIQDPEISKNHAEINLIDYNFYIKDSGSSNGTFIRLMENSNLKIREGMCFDVGSHFLKILTLDENKRLIEVSFSNDVDFDKSENFSAKFGGSKTEIIFGKKPPKSKSNIEFSKNNDLAEQHGVFTLNDKDEFELRPLKSDNEIWLKLEMPDKLKYPFCRLIPNIQIKFSASHIFIVKEGHFSDLRSCKKCENIRNTVYLNCLHSIYCLSCTKDKIRKKETKCIECLKDIESIHEIINFTYN